MFRRSLSRGGALVLTLALAGLFGCLLLRYAPGSDVDERELDPRYSANTLSLINKARAGEQNIFQFYGRYLVAAAHGDIGRSQSYNQPVATLIADRAPVTLKLIGIGLSIAWCAGICLALAATLHPSGPLLLVSELSAGCFSVFLPPSSH